MKHITFYFDFISPYAYLAFEALPQALQGLSYSVTHKPLLFAALLQHHGQLGPAEIPAKRDWTYRQVLWLAQQHAVPLQIPQSHPFNPLGLLRLAVACDPQGQPNRYVCETVFRHVWQGGLEASDPQRLQDLTQRLTAQRSLEQDTSDPSVKARSTSVLQAHAQEAIARGVFGVPAWVVDGKAFWGLDALPMLRAYLEGAPGLSDAQWDAVQHIPTGAMRRTA